MQGYWITFLDGTKGYCQGQGAWDAKNIAEKLTGKKAIKYGPNEYQPDVPTLPYPASPIIWQLDHPVNGKCPPFCYKPDSCAGKTCCPRNPSCCE